MAIREANRAGAVDAAELDREIAGLDALELELAAPRAFAARLWSALWPKLTAIAIVIGVWQAVVWSGWRPEYVLPSPFTVFQRLRDDLPDLVESAWITLKRGLLGFSFALVIGTTIGALVARSRILRAAIGSMITGLQTMPSIAWFPLAILLFELTERAILFVVVLGAAPSIANGLIHGVDNIQPVLLRAGRVLGARRFNLFRHVILPAALPAFVGGLKQGWAFAWRSLLAGELLVLIAGNVSLGQQLQFARDFSDASGLMAAMIVIFVIGVFVDAAAFGSVERYIRRRYGLVDAAEEK